MVSVIGLPISDNSFFLHKRYVSVVMLCRNGGLAHFNCVKTSKYDINYSLIDGWTCITKIWEKPQNSRRQKGDMKHVPYRGPTNISLPSKIYWPWRPCAPASNRCTMQGLLTPDRKYNNKLQILSTMPARPTHGTDCALNKVVSTAGQ